MKTKLSLKPGQKGTKRLVQQYGDRLLCIRYRYDEVRRKRYKTVELIVEEADWVPTPFINVPIKIEYEEEALRTRARTFGGYWDKQTRCWYIPRKNLKKAGLEKRLIRGLASQPAKPEASTSIYQVGIN
jgi:hypothetical protein